MRHLLLKIISSCLILIVFLSLAGCVPKHQMNIFPTSTKGTNFSDLRLVPTPEYILLVKPIGKLKVNDYDLSRQSLNPQERGLVVGFRPMVNETLRVTTTLETIVARVSMNVDGTKLPNQTLIVGDVSLLPGYGPFVFSWAPVLSPGIHEAKFQFANDSGKGLEYSWKFEITEK